MHRWRSKAARAAGYGALVGAGGGGIAFGLFFLGCWLNEGFPRWEGFLVGLTFFACMLAGVGATTGLAVYHGLTGPPATRRLLERLALGATASLLGRWGQRYWFCEARPSEPQSAKSRDWRHFHLFNWLDRFGMGLGSYAGLLFAAAFFIVVWVVYGDLGTTGTLFLLGFGCIIVMTGTYQGIPIARVVARLIRE